MYIKNRLDSSKFKGCKPALSDLNGLNPKENGMNIKFINEKLSL